MGPALDFQPCDVGDGGGCPCDVTEAAARAAKQAPGVVCGRGATARVEGVRHSGTRERGGDAAVDDVGCVGHTSAAGTDAPSVRERGLTRERVRMERQPEGVIRRVEGGAHAPFHKEE